MRGAWWCSLVLFIPQYGNADAYFDILVQDLVESVECFDPQTCSPAEGIAVLTSLDQSQTWELPVQTYGPAGLPTVYSCVVHNNGGLPFFSGWVRQVDIAWSGPGFRHVMTLSWDAFEFYYTDAPVPPPFAPTPVPHGSGCVCDPPAGWLWEECEDGPIQLDQEFVVPAGEVLQIEAGTRILAFPGALIRVEGSLVCQGTAEADIVFEGDAWHGIEFAPGATGELSYTQLSGVEDDGDGGALSLEPGSEVALDHCILHHNSTSGVGGGAFVADDAVLHLRNCTLSHNSSSHGGNLFVQEGGTATGLYNLVTFGTPQTMFCEDGPLASNLQSSCLYPLADPGQGTGWYCDPGYGDAANGDFSLSFWNSDNPLEPNCVIDVAVIDGDRDPDGTPSDMGALPFDQNDVVQPARILGVTDFPGDEGGSVMLEFAASPNDGSAINPISLYSIWVQYPGSSEMIATGQSVVATGNDRYTISIATIADSTAFNGDSPESFRHVVFVSAHSANAPRLSTLSQPVTGYSIDNLAPQAVTDFQPLGFWYEAPFGSYLFLDLEWGASTSGDVACYELFYTDPDINLPLFLGCFADTRFTHTVPFLQVIGDVFLYEVVALDSTGNRSEPATCESPVDPFLDMTPSRPAGFGLAGVSPNPFNPTTRVRFDLPSRQEVHLDLYDIRGRRAATVFAGECSVGRHEVLVDGSALASGVYFLRFQAGKTIETRRLLLLK